MMDQMNKVTKAIEKCFPTSLNLIQPFTDSDCKLAFASLIMSLPKISRSVEMISKRFVAETQQTKDL